MKPDNTNKWNDRFCRSGSFDQSCHVNIPE